MLLSCLEKPKKSSEVMLKLNLKNKQDYQVDKGRKKNISERENDLIKV